MITAYLSKSCTSCRKAEALLHDLNAEFTVVEYFKSKLSAADISAILEQTDLKLDDMLSTRSTPYKEQGLAEKSLSDDDLLEMMAKEPRLFKRPLLVSGRNAVIGYNEAAIRELVATDAAS